MELKKQTKFIKGKREIGKILICLIIAIIMLTSLKAIATTIIAGSADVIEDEKTIVRTAASVSRGASSSNKVEVASLTTELGRYASTTVTQISSETLQVKFNRTGNIYEINVNIGPTFDVTGAIPYLPVGYTPVKNTDLETGFVIEDEDGNQFVWVEVPRTAEVYPTAGINITTFNDVTYKNIEADLKTYVGRQDAVHYIDEYYNDIGLTEVEYYNQKKKILKSIYKNEGFYIGRYELGIDYAEGPRKAEGEITQQPVIKKDAYPYNYIGISQAQELAKRFETTGYGTSMMLVLQWDLIIKYLEAKGISVETMKTAEIGNFKDSTYTITNPNAKYSTDLGNTWISGIPYEKQSETRVIVTTGSNEEFALQNIYNLGGNVTELTLGRAATTDAQIVTRGGWYKVVHTTAGLMYRNAIHLGSEDDDTAVGTRVCLYKDETDTTQKPTYIPDGYTHVAGNMDEGYVIADASGNEYVWVEVPRTAEVYPTAGTSITSFTSTAYDKIEADLHTYTSIYRNGTTYTDTWYSEDATGLTSNEYYEQKNKMLKSIYKNGGFYVGRYEAGEGSTANSAVIKQNVAPRGDGIGPSKAQEISESFSTTGYTTSLMFGVQWDLMLKYLENKGVPRDDLVVDSSDWGNYGTTSIINTGSVYEFSKQNIYDIAGNLREYTLEFSGNANYPVSRRGGWYSMGGDEAPASDRYCLCSPWYQGESEGFRVCLYRDETLENEPTYIPSGYTHIAGDMDSGYVIADASGNEYVWVEVPRTATVYPTAGTNIISFTEDEFDAIEADLHTYTSVYRNETTYTDTWSSKDATGMTETEYNIQKKKMLKSIYKNGGFYVGRYEAGIDYSQNARTASGDTTQTPVIKQNAYPYNHVTASQAQALASGFETTGYETSLMFGVQWDLVLKYLETKGTAQADLKTDSTSWGNYIGNAWEISNTSAKYTTDNTTWVNGNYAGKTEENWAMLTTGASDTFCKQNIYDFAGNVFEWTLEYTTSTSKPNASRGGSCYGMGYNAPASARWQLTDAIAYNGYTFRVCLYKDESLELNRIYNASNLDGNGTTGVATTTLKDLSGNYDATIYGSPTFGNGYISLNEGSSTETQYIDMGPMMDVSKVAVNCKFSVSEIGIVHDLLGNWRSRWIWNEC